MKRRRANGKKRVGQLTKKALSVRYAEVLRLRQAIETQSVAKPVQVDRPASK